MKGQTKTRPSQTEWSINRLWAVALVCALTVLLSPAARPQPVPEAPQRIILNLTDSPAKGMAVTWRMLKGYRNAAVEYAVATPGTGFARATSLQPAILKALNVPKEPVAYHYSAVMHDLKPGTTYVCRVGKDSL
jgi:hypothetical protein